MKKRILFIVGAAVIIAGAAWLLFGAKSEAAADILTSPKRGEFTVTVTTSGELQAKNSIEIKGPERARMAGIWQMKISNLVPEGTVVKKGGLVAELDKSEVDRLVKEVGLNVQKFDAQYTQAKLDSALTLSQARDELVNLKYSVEEKKILLEQSAYEAPAMRRQAQIDYDRAERSYDQARKNYVTKRKQAIAKIQAVEVDLMKERARMGVLMDTMRDFTILAPADGMVIYAREWNGKKKVVGTTINPWESTVATLPDLSVMESITYVSEVDIQKIASGQRVRITLDADPNKVFSGTVTNVANIGEQRPNSDAKVFEVRILVNEPDTTLRPSMTTANEIRVATVPNALSIPLECIHTQGTTTFVYVRNGSDPVKRQVKLGLVNENEAIVQSGLRDNEQLYLSLPAGAAALPLDTTQVRS